MSQLDDPTRHESRHGPRHGPSPAGMPSVPEPRGSAAAGWVGLLLALLLLVLGALLIRGSFVGAGWIEGAGWFAGAVDVVDGAEPSVTVGLVAAAVALLGLVPLMIALRPRPHPYRRLGDASGVYAHRSLIEKSAEHAARQVSGVVSAHASLGRRLDVRVASTGGEHVKDAATESVSDCVQALQEPPGVVLRTRPSDPTKEMA